MASKVKHNFKESALALLRGDWCNRVARRVSYWMGCNGVDVSMPDMPSGNDPIKVGLNVPTAAKILAGEMLSKNLLGRTPTLPLTLKAILNSDNSAVNELRVYLPDTTVGFGRTDYPLRIGSNTGYLTAVTGDAGWYTINGITTGTIWLVDDSIEQTVNGVVVRTPRAKFATAALGTANRLNTLVGQVSATGGVVQTEPLRKGWLGDCEGEHDGQTAMDITLTTNANDLAIFQQEGHRLNTDTWQRGVTGLAKVTVNGDSQTIAAVQDADGNQPLCGTKIRCFTRVIRAVDIDWFVYRELEFDKNGCLRSISAEKGVHGECNYAYS